MSDLLQVPVGKLHPGSMGADNMPNPMMKWSAWEDTFRLLMEHPCLHFDQWPIYPYWEEWCMFRFGRLPGSGDHPSCGAAWAWPCWEASFRRMLASFQKHGYRPELATGGEQEIQAIIDDMGRIVVCQGNKRVALIRLFSGLDTVVPVEIKRRSPRWEELKRGLWSVGEKEDLYQPLPHPDFAEWSVAQPCVERRDMMLSTEQGEKCKSVLDVGCHTGWFCRMFAERGAYSVGVDANPIALKAAEAMDLYCGPQCKYIEGDIGTFLDGSIEQFDVCLLLSVAMHVFTKYGKDGGWKVLNDLSARAPAMFMDIVYGAYSDKMPFTPENMPEQMVANTMYTNYKLLGHTAHENRPLYVFWREQ